MIERARSDFNVPQTQVRDPSGTVVALRQGLSGVQQATSEVQNAVRQKLERKQRADGAAALLDNRNKYTLGIQELETEAQNNAPETGDGYLKAVREGRAKLRDELLADLPSYLDERARQAIANQFTAIDGDSDLRATKWQEETATRYASSAYEQTVNNGIAEVLADPTTAPQVRTRLKTALEALGGRLTPEAEAQALAGTEQRLAEAAVTGFANQGDFAAARGVVQEFKSVLDVDQQKALENMIERGEAERKAADYETRALAIMEGELDRSGIEALHKAGEIDDGEKARHLSQVQQAERARESERAAEFAKVQAQNFAALQVGIDDGVYGRGDADQLYKDGLISSAQWSQAARQANTASEGRNRAAEVAGLIDLGVPLDPRDSDTKKGVDALFEQMGGRALFVEDFAQGLETTEMFLSVGVMPETSRSVIRGMIASGTPEQQQASIDALGRLYEKYPNAIDASFSAGEVAESISFAHKLDAGVETQNAYDAVLLEREARNEPPGATSLTKARVAESRKLVLDYELKDAVKAADTGAFTFDEYAGDALAEAQIVADFQQAFQTYYVQHGDEDLAKKQAQAVIGRTVAKSSVNGGRIMAHPPEKYYAPDGGETDWMTDALVTGVSDYYGETLARGQIELVSDGLTAREARDGLYPSYAVMVTTNGRTDTLPERFTWEPELADYKKQERERQQRRDREREKEKSVDRAKAQRASFKSYEKAKANRAQRMDQRSSFRVPD